MLILVVDMDTTKTPSTETPEETPEEREKLLSALDAEGRDLIERVMAHHPKLTAAETIEYCREMGGL
jgi:hypothetical protein